MSELFHIFFNLIRLALVLLLPGGLRKIAAENLLIRHQARILSRGRKKAPNLTTFDRLIIGFCAFFTKNSRLVKNAIVIKPSTLLSLHRALVKRKYSKLFSSKNSMRKPGPKGPKQEIIAAVVEMKKNNPKMGCLMIANQINDKFNEDMDKDVVRRILAKHYQPAPNDEGPSWLTVLGHAKDSLWSLDFFRCDSVFLTSHWVLVIMDQHTRKIIGFAVHKGNLSGEAICKMFGEVTGGLKLPRRISHDNDPLFKSERWKANMRILKNLEGMTEVWSVPHVPVSHPFCERLIGTVRREYLDHIFFIDSKDLEGKLKLYQDYFNEIRVHSSLDGKTPAKKYSGAHISHANLEKYQMKSYCRGLFKIPIAA